MKKIDALKAFDAWLKDIKEDLILEELFCSIRSDERLESLKALRKELLFSDSPLEFADLVVRSFVRDAMRCKKNPKEFPLTSGFISVLFGMLLEGQDWEAE